MNGFHFPKTAIYQDMAILYYAIAIIAFMLNHFKVKFHSKKKLLNSQNDLYLFLNNNFKLKISEYKKIIRPFLNYYLFLPKFIKKLEFSKFTSHIFLRSILGFSRPSAHVP